jgi:negative regulator of sigma E activity
MDCRAVDNLASAWLDGKLTSGEADFLRHLDGCRTCARETGELQAVLTAFRTTGAAVPAPAGFAGRVMARLQEEPLRDGTHLLFRKLALAASFLFLLGMNSLLVGRYLGGSNRVTLPPVPAPAAGPVTEPAPPELSPDRIEQPVVPVPGGQEALPAKPELIAPAVSAPTAASVPAPAAPVRQPAKAQVVPSPPPVSPDRQQEPEQQLRVATLSPAVIPDPEVFVQQRRVTEGVLLKVAVTELSQASQRLADAAGVQGLTPVMASEALAEDGRLIKVYRYEVPYLQANRFVTEALKLGRVLDERHVAEDVSNEYGRKLEQYRQLAAKAQEAGGAEAEELHRSINGLLLELAGMHSAARDMKAVTVWLES